MHFQFCIGLYLLAQGAAFTAAGLVIHERTYIPAGLMLTVIGAFLTWLAVDEWCRRKR